MSFLRRLLEWLPSPFKRLRSHLNIEQQWQQFKHHIRPHRTKIVVAGLVLTYPLYSKQAIALKDYVVYRGSVMFDRWLGVQHPPFQITQNFVKNVIGSVLNDNNIRHQGLQFVNSIIQQDKFVADILQLLVSALKNSHFMANLQDSSKDLTLKLLADPQIQSTLKTTITQTVGSQQVKSALISLIQQVFSSKQSVDVLVGLLLRGISNQQVKQSLAGSVNYSVQQLLKDEQMINQLKIFIFFLLRRFQNDDQIKNMMDILFAKGLGLGKKKKSTFQAKTSQDRAVV